MHKLEYLSQSSWVPHRRNEAEEIYNVKMGTNLYRYAVDGPFTLYSYTLNRPWLIPKKDCLIYCSLTHTKKRVFNFLLCVFACSCLLTTNKLKVVISQGFICPLCMKRCVSAADLSGHYQEVHTEPETGAQGLPSDSSVTVGPAFCLPAWFWVAQNSFVFPVRCWFPFMLYGNADCFNNACLKEESIRKKGSWTVCLVSPLGSSSPFVNL